VSDSMIDRLTRAFANTQGALGGHGIDLAALARLIDRFKERYGSFADQRYLDDERTYKLMAAERMRERLGQEMLGALIAEGRYDEAKTAILQSCQGTFTINAGLRQQNNLLNQWDLRVLLDAPADELTHRLSDLLYGDAPFAERFDAWVALLSAAKPGVWPAATYFLMLHNPAQHIYVKPTPFQHFLKEVGADDTWQTRPDAVAYERLRQLGEGLLEVLREIGAHDMIDVQSFIWLSGRNDNGANGTSLEEWLVALRTQNPLNHRLIDIYPEWLYQQFDQRVRLLPGANQELFVNLDGRFVQRLRINDAKGAEVWFTALSDRQVERLRSELVNPATLNQKASQIGYPRNWRFNLTGESDIALVRELMMDLASDSTALRDTGSEAGRRIRVRSTTLADAAFFVLSRAGGGPMHLSDMLDRIQQEELAETRGQTPHLSLSSTLLRDERFQNLGKNTWILAELVEDTDGDEDADEDRAETVEPPTRQPALYADEEAHFWRIHFPRQLWEQARQAGVIAIGWSADSTNQSVKRFHQIVAGDRVVAYVQGGVIGGIGVVTAAFDRENPRAGLAIGMLGDDSNQFIRVAWADAPADPQELLDALKHSRYTALYNRIKNPHTVIPLSRDDYTTLLSLLQVDDAGQPAVVSRLPNVWTQLAAYLSLARSLGAASYTAEGLVAAARTIDPPPAEPLDADDLVTELLQLRLIEPVDANTYRTRPYVSGDTATLLRLCALALLVPLEGSAEQYMLVARAILPRLRASAEPQAAERFAPELNAADSVTLAEWYAEAGLIDADGTSWRPLPDALSPAQGDDLASTTYNQLLRALIDDSGGKLVSDLPHVPFESSLPHVEDLDDRLRELGRDLLFDSAVVRRIYRSLLAGRHVVLSGPPGTGKTELARRLPSLLWREPPQSFRRLTLRLEQSPVEEVTVQRNGYAPVVVTATEDWGVRDVVGGIGPRLDGQSGALGYTIEHGALTRTVLQHYDETSDGRRLPTQATGFVRRDYRPNPRERYRGAWLVIDEFTRAPIDAAFGSLLTTLSGGQRATVAVPTRDGELREVPLPRDFRIIGTLNSFDRHFLNQLSEAMKRRFDFIDVLPPPPSYSDFEQGIAAKQALRRMHEDGFAQIERDGEPTTYRWPGTVAAEPTVDGDGLQRYRWRAESPDAERSMTSFWRLFSAIRVFRQLGTAQIVAVYLNLFTGARVGMSWPEALDTALADALADQLQVLTRDEQRTIDALVECAGKPAEFVSAVRSIMRDLPPGRRSGYVYALRECDAAVNGESDIAVREDAALTDAQITRVFAVDEEIALPKTGVFRRRLRDLIGERGL
jgi:5-methylcytosine-specific restriction enzyme B